MEHPSGVQMLRAGNRKMHRQPSTGELVKRLSNWSRSRCWCGAS